MHYSDRGTGRPVVLVQGNAVTGGDYNTSGVAEQLLGAHCRVIIFDRPGFGYSERPRERVWTAAAQADLLHAALLQLGVQRPVVVGHSWGTLVALALAVRHPRDVAGLVLLAGYYFPTPRLDALLVAVVTVPVLGDVLRYTLSPVFGWLTMPALKRAMFAPAPMTARFEAEYSTAIALRPSQIRATAGDGTLMVPGAMELRNHYGDLKMPVFIMAGDGDLVIGDRQVERLHAAIPGSTLRIVKGVGHMIHHVATRQVVDAIEEVARKASDEAPTDAGPGPRAFKIVGGDHAAAVIDLWSSLAGRGVVQNGRFMGYTKSGQGRANQGLPRFACNPDLNHAPHGLAEGRPATRRGREPRQRSAGSSR